jgi:hypothetical protein
MIAVSNTPIGMNIAKMIFLLSGLWETNEEAVGAPVWEVVGGFTVLDGRAVEEDDGKLAPGMIARMNTWEPDVCIDIEVAFNVTSIVDDNVLCGTEPASMKVLGSNEGQDFEGTNVAVISMSDLLRR